MPVDDGGLNPAPGAWTEWGGRRLKVWSARPVDVSLPPGSLSGAGTLNLIFDRKSSELRQWTVTDQQGLQTMVALYNVETGNQLAADLFKIDYAAATNAARDKTR